MLGNIIGAGASLLGGLLGKSSAEANRESQERMAAQNIALQKEFAQSGIQWKVQDAEKAGINPLYALGASTSSFSPVSVGGGPDMSMSNAVGRMGQDIGRAIDSTATPSGKVSAYDQQRQNLQLENGFLQNQLLSAQIAKLRQTPSNPANPAPGSTPTANNPFAPEIAGQGDSVGLRGSIPWESKKLSGYVEPKPMEQTASHPKAPWGDPAPIHTMGWARTGHNSYEPVKSKDMQERLEDDHLGNMMWFIKNRIAPSVGFNQSPPPAALPPGYDAWVYNPFRQEYTPHKKLTRYGPYY